MTQGKAVYVAISVNKTIKSAFFIDLAIIVQSNYIVGRAEAMYCNCQILPWQLELEYIPALVARITVVHRWRRRPSGPRIEEKTSSSVAASSPLSILSRMTNVFLA